MRSTNASDNSESAPIRLPASEQAGMFADDCELSKRLDTLCAELMAIEYWDWLDRTGGFPQEPQEEVRELRLARREIVTSQIHVLFAQQARYLRLD